MQKPRKIDVIQALISLTTAILLGAVGLYASKGNNDLTVSLRITLFLAAISAIFFAISWISQGTRKMVLFSAGILTMLLSTVLFIWVSVF